VNRVIVHIIIEGVPDEDVVKVKKLIAEALKDFEQVSIDVTFRSE